MKQFSLTKEALYVETLRQQWLVEREALRKLLAECNASRTSPGPNYWEAEHRAEQRFLMAVKVLTVLEGT